MKSGSYDAIQIKNGIADSLLVNDLKVNNISIKDELLKSDIGISSKRVKELYESESNTNVFTDEEKQYIKRLIGKNSSVNGGAVISGNDNRVTGKSSVFGSRNTVLANDGLILGNDNTVIHEKCIIVGNDCLSTKNNQTIIGGNNLSFKLPLVDNIVETDLPEQGMSLCLDPNDGSLLFKVKFMNEMRVFRAPTYGQTIKLNTAVENNMVKVTPIVRNM
tara:strand:- start:3344 stop:4000 length:657 start_codon:yes stop_codon:yes gene_type:complete